MEAAAAAAYMSATCSDQLAVIYSGHQSVDARSKLAGVTW